MQNAVTYIALCITVFCRRAIKSEGYAHRWTVQRHQFELVNSLLLRSEERRWAKGRLQQWVAGPYNQRPHSDRPPCLLTHRLSWISKPEVRRSHSCIPVLACRHSIIQVTGLLFTEQFTRTLTEQIQARYCIIVNNGLVCLEYLRVTVGAFIPARDVKVLRQMWSRLSIPLFGLGLGN